MKSNINITYNDPNFKLELSPEKVTSKIQFNKKVVFINYNKFKGQQYKTAKLFKSV